MSAFEQEIQEVLAWFETSRFDGITRLYSARQVVEQRGTIPTDYPIARFAADQFFGHLRDLFELRRLNHDVRPLLPWPSCLDEADGNQGDLPRRLGHLRQRLD